MSCSSLSFSDSRSLLVKPRLSTVTKRSTNSHKAAKVAVQCTAKLYSLTSRLLQKSIPLAASMSILLCSFPADAGILSGFSGLESVPGPELPEIDFLKKFNEENQKKYAENDARFKSSPVLKELLERSKQNKEKNRREIQDKYCIRGAEWGVGDCSTDGMSVQERENFIAMLKKKSDENQQNTNQQNP